MSNWKTNYPLRSRLDAAERIVALVANEYGLELGEMQSSKQSGRRQGQGGIVFGARIEAARRCIAACIRPQHFAAVIGISVRNACKYYRWFWMSGRGPECVRQRVAS